MGEAEWFLLGVVVGAVIVFASAYVGWRYWIRAQRQVEERLRRIDPGPRTPDLPTNIDGEPSVVRRSRMWR